MISGLFQRVAILALLCSASAGLAQAEEAEHAQEGHHATFDGKAFAFQVANFGILAFILLKFGGKAANKALRARHDQLKIDLADASRAKTEAEAKLKEQDLRLSNLEQEVLALRASLKAEAEHEQQKLIAAAEDRARRIQVETQFLLDQQVKDAERRFREEMAGAAVQVAEELIRRSILGDDEQRLAQSFVAELGRPAQEIRS